ncbi:hypothetical protein ACLB2K_074965 [Fragaria x ananassa]
MTTAREIRSIRVDGLPLRMDETYFFHCFHDNAKAATVLRHWRTGVPLDYGFVEFASQSDAEFVLESYHGDRMPNSYHERRFCLSWDTDHSGTCWRWNSTYTDCSYFGYDELGNKVNAKTLINKCSISRRRAYNQMLTFSHR